MTKAYYLKYGLISKDIASFVRFIETEIGIKLTNKNTYDELYVLLKKKILQ